MVDGVQTLEKRLQRLELLLAAEGSPSKVVRMDITGEPGAIEAKFDEVALSHGFKDHREMESVAHTQFVGVSLPYLQGRRVGVTTTEQAEAFQAGTWAPYSRNGAAESYKTNNESVDPKPQPTPGNVARAAIPAEGLEATE